MPTVNYTNPNLDRTVRIFDNFYKFNLEVDPNEYDVVYSYFRAVMDNETAAKNFTMTLFQASNESKIPVLDLLAQLQSEVPAAYVTNNQGQYVTNPSIPNQGTPQLQLTSLMTFYLNNLRSNATLLGVTVPVVPNYYAARNVLP